MRLIATNNNDFPQPTNNQEPDFKHIPVMLDECIEALNIKQDGIYVDGTMGGCGHSAPIAASLTPSMGGRLIAIDCDPDAVAVGLARLKGLEAATVVHGSYCDIAAILSNEGINAVDGILLDLGVSSFQLDQPHRGFSYHSDGLLDMRMSKEGKSAYDVVNFYSEGELIKILYEYGEERFAKKIAGAIVTQREAAEIKTTLELSEIINNSVPHFYKRDKNPSQKTFQAIRIEVNEELTRLKGALESCFSVLKPGGRLAVITFHSLEDRIVKNFFKEKTQGCTCPMELPLCVCNSKPQGSLVYRKPITSGEKELSENRRSRSAKLRVLERA